MGTDTLARDEGDQRHQWQETVVRDAQDSNLACSRNILTSQSMVCRFGGVMTGVGFWVVQRAIIMYRPERYLQQSCTRGGSPSTITCCIV